MTSLGRGSHNNLIQEVYKKIDLKIFTIWFTLYDKFTKILLNFKKDFLHFSISLKNTQFFKIFVNFHYRINIIQSSIFQIDVFYEIFFFMRTLLDEIRIDIFLNCAYIYPL